MRFASELRRIINGRMVSHAILIFGLMFAGRCFGELETAAGRVPFWISTMQPDRINEQAAALLAMHASVVVLRMPETEQAARAIERVRRHAPQVPVLMYALINRSLPNQPGSKRIMDWMSEGGGDMQVRRQDGRTLSGFGDVTRKDFRAKAAANVVAAADRGRFDGVAIDLAVRTPTYRPKPLAAMCKTADNDYCADYAAGMDATFGALRTLLGRRPILYNGLWNFGPGSVADQMQLLRTGDAAIVEYFGGDPKSAKRSFSTDVLPYLEAMTQIPSDKKLVVFGRGSWQYQDYANDYLWQRYLYCSYLLAAHANTYFSYNSTFRLPSRAGRTGGLTIYADWLIDLGAPKGKFEVTGGLYIREFTKGIVLVAPDDGAGGSRLLTGTLYSPEGRAISGRVMLGPGEAMLLKKSVIAPGGRQSVLGIDTIGELPQATMKEDGERKVASIKPSRRPGDHILLDPVREMDPRTGIRLRMRPQTEATRIRLVAEVDDSERVKHYAVIAVKAKRDDGGHEGPTTETFRDIHTAALSITAEMRKGQWQDIEFDGDKVFGNNRALSFKRWDSISFDSPVDIESVQLLH